MLQRISKMLIPFLVMTGLFIVASQSVSAAYQELYVDGELTWVDYGTYVHGPITSPYLTITEALNDLDADGGTIYVAEGNYTEDLNITGSDEVRILGGYNGGPGDPAPFTDQDRDAHSTMLNGKIDVTNTSGQISGMTFGGQLGVNYIISVNNTSSGLQFAVSDNYFGLSTVVNYFVRINSGTGSVGEIINNYFTLASSDQSVVDATGAGDSLIDKNYFNASSSLNGSYGIIRATDGAIVRNNLIANSGANNRVAIRISNSAQVYNNTVVGGTASSGAIASSGSGHTLYNNLVNGVTGDDYVLSPNAVAENNYGEGDCDPDFAAGSGAAAYKLGANSTCIDGGRGILLVSDDYFGTSRPSGEEYDPGFHEFYIAQACGNGYQETGEQCDDGNLTNGDGCSSSCTIESSGGVCGDGTVDSGEQCDDGNSVNGDGCSATCLDEVQVSCGGWLDIDSTDSHYNIAVYLCNHGGIVQGDGYGNLRIDDLLTRAELLAMAFRAREYENLGMVDPNAEACFPDVVDDWYAKYFCTAKDDGFVQGYPDGNAKPGNIVLLGEGLKMFLGALDLVYNIDLGDCWYCSMVEASDTEGWIPFNFTDPTEVGPMQLSRRYSMDMLYRILTN